MFYTRLLSQTASDCCQHCLHWDLQFQIEFLTDLGNSILLYKLHEPKNLNELHKICHGDRRQAITDMARAQGTSDTQPVL